MARVRVDFSQAKEFEAIPEGAYPATLEETEVREGSEYPYVNWTFKISTGEFAGRRQWLMTSTAPKAAWGLKSALIALGETNESIVGKDVQYVDIDPDDYLGREVIINVIQETYQDVLRNKIDSLSPTKQTATGCPSRRMR